MTDLDRAKALMDQGIEFSKAGRAREALDITQQATQLYRAIYAEDSSQAHRLAGVLNNLAIELSIVGRIAESVGISEEATALMRKHGEDGDLGIGLLNLGHRYYDAENYPAAGGSYEEAVEVLRRAAVETPDKHEQNLVLALGCLCRLMADKEQAMPYALEALNLVKSRLDEPSPMLCRQMADVGWLLYEMDREDLSVPLLAVTTKIALQCDDPPSVMHALDALARQQGMLDQSLEAVATHSVPSYASRASRDRPHIVTSPLRWHPSATTSRTWRNTMPR